MWVTFLVVRQIRLKTMLRVAVSFTLNWVSGMDVMFFATGKELQAVVAHGVEIKKH